MKLTHLEAFLALAEDGSVERTARRIGTTPAALGTAMGELESSLGLRLFVRSIDSFELSAAGRAMFERADEAVEALDRRMR